MPIADLHCHYPMHLLADGEAKPDPVLKAMTSVKKKPRWDKFKALLLKVAARTFNFRRFCDTWRVDLERLAEGKVKLVFSVLYMPDAEMNIEDWPNGSPDDDYYGELTTLIKTVNKSLEGDGTPAQRKAVVVKAPGDLEPAPGDDLPRFVHCIEGGFHLGGTASRSTPASPSSPQRASPTSPSPTSSGAGATNAALPSSPTASTATSSRNRAGSASTSSGGSRSRRCTATASSSTLAI